MLPGVEAQTLYCVMYSWKAVPIEEAIVAQPVSKFQPFSITLTSSSAFSRARYISTVVAPKLCV